MRGFASRGRSKVLLAIAAALLAIVVRLPSPPDTDAAAPWVRGSLALQGIRPPGDSADSRGDLVVTLPLLLAESVSFVAARVAGGAATGDRGGWIRQHEGLWKKFLWGLWITAAAAAAYLAAQSTGGGLAPLAGFLVAIAPVGLAGTRRLDGWALAAPLVLSVLCRAGGDPLRRSSGARGTAALAVIWGALLSLTPLGFLLALFALLAGRKQMRIAILFAVPLWFALDPSRLASPIEAIGRLAHSFAFAGWPGLGDGPPGRLLLAAWTPGLIVLFFACLGGWRRARGGDMPAAAGLLALWFIPALLGAKRPDAVGLIAPAALVLAAEGAVPLITRSARSRPLVLAALALLLAVPGAHGALLEIKGNAERRSRAGLLGEIVRERVAEGMLLLRDPSTPALPDSVASFALPTYVERPEAWDFAYWPGWYGGFSYALMKAGTLEGIEDDQQRRPAGRSFLAALSAHADPIVSLGDPATDRSALVLFRLRPGPPWKPPSIIEPWENVKASRAEAHFLADLGGFLAGHGRGGDAIEILRLAIKWDDSDPTAWNNLGSTLLIMGEAQSAASTFEEGLRRDPSSLELRYNLAKAFLAGNIPGRAILELRRVLHANPGFAPAHYDLARAAAAEENWPLAVQALEAYVAMEPAAPNHQQIETALAEARRRAERARSSGSDRRLRPAGGAGE